MHANLRAKLHANANAGEDGGSQNPRRTIERRRGVWTGEVEEGCRACADRPFLSDTMSGGVYGGGMCYAVRIFHDKKRG